MSQIKPMSDAWTGAVWRQLGAALEMLENAMNACPEDVWGDNARYPEFWNLAYHTLFFLDYYFSESADGFHPPAPFTLSELDPAGVLPDRVYAKDELLAYLRHGRHKAMRVVATMSEAKFAEPCAFTTRGMNNLEWILYSTRHVQHHAAQLNLLLRQRVDAAPKWVSKAALPLAAG